jgi:hypothetical protein
VAAQVRPLTADLWTALHDSDRFLDQEVPQAIGAWGRLPPGASRTAARARWQTVVQHWRQRITALDRRQAPWERVCPWQKRPAPDCEAWRAVRTQWRAQVGALEGRVLAVEAQYPWLKSPEALSP